jgi:hypothetical protein
MGISKLRRYCPEDDRMVLAEKQTPNHILHLILSLVTAGLWIIVWVLVALLNDFNAYRCPHCGGKTRHKPPRGWKKPPRREVYEDEAG